jgi:hypothetical protein
MANTHRAPEQWQKIFEQHASSGLQITAFCKQQKLNTSSFYAWPKRLALTNERFAIAVTNNPTSKDNKVDDWVNIIPEQVAPSPSWDIELTLPNGVILRMNNS